ncbi:toxin-antitoxin system YwqK family antitoxin [Chitinophaga sp. S165]|uniref:toxin-antitoxin system YwqK family antitoxin n=1 Tax=Chitinophaga sp. S165 TaxID=2135462 RepID=UPI000D70F9B3|nr:hypothetical protein [Chitinophaga sp. S165]PWV45408.1 MORN repeat protein [Chitinophaga sp. S165]
MDTVITFDNTEGQGILSVRANDYGCYFHFRRPRTATWFGGHGTIERYLMHMQYSKEEREEIRRHFNSGLNKDYLNDLPALKELLRPLFPLLPKGRFAVHFHNETNDWVYKKSTEPGAKTGWEYLQDDKVVDRSRMEALQQEHAAWQAEDPEQRRRTDIFDYKLYACYGYGDLRFVATQPSSETNMERVYYYMDRIKEGERPVVITLSSFYSGTYHDTDPTFDSYRYIIDGHHKLKAYQCLNILPTFADMIHLMDSPGDAYFDLEELADVLYPWQTKDILENWTDVEKYFGDAMSNPESKIYPYVRNGLITSILQYGERHEAFYVNGRIEGEEKTWNRNGQLTALNCWKNGVMYGERKSWHHNGQLSCIVPLDDKGEVHGAVIHYYENGKIRSEQWWDHRKYKDGYSKTEWDEDGRIKAEWCYKNDQLYERKEYDITGKQTAFYRLDEKEHKMKEIKSGM